MIIDKIENSSKYKPVHKRLSAAFKYLKHTDLKKLDVGTHKIEGDDVFAIVTIYDSKIVEEPMLEAHQKYIDIQVVESGYELVGFEMLKEQEILKAYDDEKDIVFYEGEPSYFKLEPGMFAVFFPEDLHMPGICAEKPVRVKKIVVKVKV